jgi:glucose uptake protein GlcU
MALSGDEQRLLDGIETGLRSTDPAFAVKLTLEAAASYRRRQVGLVHGCLWLGMFMTLAGFALVHQVLAAGVLVILYGTGTLIFALSAVWQLRQWDTATRSVTGRRGRDR